MGTSVRPYCFFKRLFTLWEGILSFSFGRSKDDGVTEKSWKSGEETRENCWGCWQIPRFGIIFWYKGAENHNFVLLGNRSAGWLGSEYSEFHNFDLERFRTFRPMVPKVSLLDFYPFCAPHGRKLRVGLFDRFATKIWIRSFWGATMGQIFKILTWRDFGPSRQWSRKFPSWIFYPFWGPHDRKL